jgi:hypothetical protein
MDEMYLQKDKVMQQMNAIMMAFEDSKQQKLQSFAEFLRDSYRDKYRIDF